MRAYSVFDDLTDEACAVLRGAGIEVTLHPKGEPRPRGDALRVLLEQYDVVFLSTAERVTEEMLSGIDGFRIIATASAGTDHICIPEEKRASIRIANAPSANAVSVAEHTFALFLALKKRLSEARSLAARGQNKQQMCARPAELCGLTLGVLGAGPTAAAVLRLGQALGMRCLCWTRAPERHEELRSAGVEFAEVETVLRQGDAVSLNLPLTAETVGFLTAERIELMKPDAAFVSVSRPELMDCAALFDRSRRQERFSVGLDVDAGAVLGLWDEGMKNVMVTPHIAGGTTAARERLFAEAARNAAALCRQAEAADRSSK